MDEAQPDFTGKAADLLHQVTPTTDGWRPPRGWPRDARQVTSILKRNAPALRKAGWIIEDEPGHARYVIWTITHPEKARISHHPHHQSEPDASDASDAEPKLWPVCQQCNDVRLLHPQSQQLGLCFNCQRKGAA